MKSKIYCLFLHKKLDKALICPYICSSFLGLRALSSAERWRQGFFYAFCIFEKINTKNPVRVLIVLDFLCLKNLVVVFIEFSQHFHVTFVCVFINSIL